MNHNVVRQDIEGLRAISILAVVVYHLAPGVLPGGYIGVDVFFVISGYLITERLMALITVSDSWVDALTVFWAGRVRRLLPNALTVIVLCLVYGLIFFDSLALRRLGSDVGASAAQSINWLYYWRVTDYLNWSDSSKSLLLHYWSLSIEAQFYWVWPLLLALIIWVSRRSKALNAVALILFLFAGSLLYATWLAQSDLGGAFFSTPARAWEMLAGALVFVIINNSCWGTRFFGLGALTTQIRWLLVICVVACFFWFDEDTSHPGLMTLWPVAASSLILLLNQQCYSRLQTVALQSLTVKWLASRSFAIYLWHWPLFMMFGASRGEQSHVAWWGEAAVGLVLSCLLAEISYRLIERPFRKYIGLKLTPLRVIMVGLMASGLVVALGFGVRWYSVVRADTSEMTLKSGLPPMGSLAADIPFTYFNGCHLDIPEIEPKPCMAGDVGSERVMAVFGDSHAAQWLPALHEWAGQARIKLIVHTKSSCPSVDVLMWMKSARAPYFACKAWYVAVMSALHERPPEWILLSSFVERAPSLANDRGVKIVDSEMAAEMWAAGLERTIKNLGSSGSKIIVLRDSPKPRDDFLECVYGKSEVESCGVTKEVAFRSRSMDVDVARRLGVTVWDWTPWFCQAEHCPALVKLNNEQFLVYRDHHHLSAKYVRAQALNQLSIDSVNQRSLWWPLP